MKVIILRLKCIFENEINGYINPFIVKIRDINNQVLTNKNTPIQLLMTNVLGVYILLLLNLTLHSINTNPSTRQYNNIMNINIVKSNNLYKFKNMST